jgi:streptogramin lyase
VVLVVAVGALVTAGAVAGGPSAKPRLVSSPPASAGATWSALLASPRKPSVAARKGVTTISVSVRRAARNRYRLRAVFPFSGAWQLRSRGRTFGSVKVSPAGPLPSAIPSARAFRLCNGSSPPFPQYALAVDGSLWVGCRAGATLRRVDPATGEARAILRVSGASPYAVAAGFGAVWSAERGPVVGRIDLRTGRATQAFTGTGFSYVWTAAGSVWAHDDDARRLIRYDPIARRIVAQLPTGDGASALVEQGGLIWIVNHRDGTLERIDPASNSITPLSKLPGDAPERMVFAAGSLWVTGRGTDLLRVDPATGAVQATIEIGAGGIDVRAAGGSIWVVAPTTEDDLRGNPFVERVLRIDPAANAIVETIRPTGRVTVNGTAVTGTAFWIADTEHGRLYRLTR